jgi:hypothetical protein
MEAPKGVVVLGIGPTLRAALGCDLSGSLEAAGLLEAPMTSLLHEPLPGSPDID